MSTDPAHAGPTTLTSLPRLEDLPRTGGGGVDPDAVSAAFDNFRRHVLQLQAQLRVLQAAGQAANVEPTGHAVRMDALHLIRAASEFADTLERDAQSASAAQLARTEAEVRRRQRELQNDEAELERKRIDTERQIAEMLNAANHEAAEVRKTAERDATATIREAEARGTRLVEQARHQATEMTNAVRAEVEQTLDWARTQAEAIMARTRDGAEQLLTAAGLGADALHEVADAIVGAAQSSVEGRRPATLGAATEPSASSAEPSIETPGESE